MFQEMMRFGLVELTDVPIDEDSATTRPSTAACVQAVESRLSEVRDTLAVLDRLFPEKKPLFSFRRETTAAERDRVLAEAPALRGVVSEIKAADDALNRLRAEENRLKNLKTALLPWIALDMDVSLTGTRHVRFQLGTVPAATDTAALGAAIERDAPLAVLEEQGADNENRYFLLSVHESEEASALGIVKSYGWNRIQFKDASGSPKSVMSGIDGRIGTIAHERKSHIDDIGGKAGHRRDLEVLHDLLAMERDREAAIGRLAATRKTFLLEGWVPAEEALKLASRLEKRFACHIRLTDPAPDEPTPVAGRSNAFTEGIQPVMNMYGTPSSLEIDPSAVTMPFFIFFFGIIISDAGYGAILALGSFLVLRMFKLEAPVRRFAKLILYSGLATIVCGVLFGGYFGIEALADSALWFNPGTEEGKNRMMVFTLFLGVLHLFTGHMMKAANLIRRGLLLDALFDVAFPVVMYAGFAMAVLPNVPGLDPVMTAGVSALGVKVLVVGLALSIIVAGRKNRSVFGRIFGGLPKIYDIISFLGDVLSYLRLLALSMSGAILGGLFNGMGTNGSLAFKLTAGLLILLFGHVINFAMGILGAFVHSCRLQYLEFFSKFLEGGGEAFRPLQPNTAYITIKQEDD